MPRPPKAAAAADPVPPPAEHDALAARVHAALPQTQCTRCGYADCAGYASAIALMQADINQCPPGGAEGIVRLAAITGQPVRPMNPVNGAEGPRAVAVIDESWCIGCTLCLKVCPTDAIIGSNKQMHTVVERWCTGCELCLPACPVDCISLENVSGEQTGWDAWSPMQAAEALDRYQFHQVLWARAATENEAALEARALKQLADLPGQTQSAEEVEAERKRAVIEAALARARARRSGDAA